MTSTWRTSLHDYPGSPWEERIRARVLITVDGRQRTEFGKRMAVVRITLVHRSDPRAVMRRAQTVGPLEPDRDAPLDGTGWYYLVVIVGCTYCQTKRPLMQR